MKFSDNAMSIILLCSYLGISKDDMVKPFLLGEWNYFLDKIIEMKLESSIVLGKELAVLKELQYSDNEIERVKKYG